jgi:endonuclease/exonuclease/phosphatase family metal-dependent hydrolase
MKPHVHLARGCRPEDEGIAHGLAKDSLSDSTRVTVASYNIHLGIGTDGSFEPARIAAVIRELEADVIALQEVGLGSPGFNMLQYLRDACGMDAIAGPTLVAKHGDYGNAVLTRFRTTKVRRLDLTVPHREPRGALDIELDCHGRPLRMLATHLGLRPGERRSQIKKLLTHIRETSALPVILIGDLNEWFLWGRPVRWLRQHFNRTPSPATFPSSRPLFALDRVWVQPLSRLKSVAVHLSARARVASDHLPLKAVLDLALTNGCDKQTVGITQTLATEAL